MRPDFLYERVELTAYKVIIFADFEITKPEGDFSFELVFIGAL